MAAVDAHKINPSKCCSQVFQNSFCHRDFVLVDKMRLDVRMFAIDDAFVVGLDWSSSYRNTVNVVMSLPKVLFLLFVNWRGGSISLLQSISTET